MNDNALTQLQSRTIFQAVALHIDDVSAWQRIGHETLSPALAKYRREGQVMSELDGVLYMPLGALPELAPSSELEPTDPARLADCLRQAWQLLDRVWPEAGRETRYFVRAVASGRLPPGRQSSGSSEARPWAIRIDCCIDDPVHLLADAVVHEAAHVKLRLSRLMPCLCEKDDTPRLHHPWRTELRPLSAVMVACHAFVAVHGFHARCCALAISDATSIEATLRKEVAQTLNTLSNAAGLTHEGHTFTELLRTSYAANCQLARANLIPT